jgi:signal transduction histidine kinase
MNLKFKFVLLFLIFLIIIVSFASYSIYLVQKDFLTQKVQKDRDSFFSSFLSICREALKSTEENQIDTILSSILAVKKSEIVYTFFISGYREILVLKESNDYNLSIFSTRAMRGYTRKVEMYTAPNGETICEYSAPAMFGDKYMGSLIVGFSQDYIYSQIKDEILLLANRIIAIAIFSILLSVFGINLILDWLIEPIMSLIKTLKEISKTGTYKKINIRRDDELGQLTTTFNEMIDKVNETNDLKDEFISNVSHELKTPLSAIGGYCNLLLDSIDKNYSNSKTQQLKGLKIIKESTVRLTNFINDILDLAKIKSGKFELKIIPLSIDEIIKELFNLFHPLAVTQEKKLIYNASDNLPLIKADSEKIKQVITNLLSNAFKFTNKGDVIKISLSYDDKYAEVSVSDTGIGIEKKHLKKVFERFYQIKYDKYKKPKGTGIGLSIAYQIIEMHNGRIWVESEPGNMT